MSRYFLITLVVAFTILLSEANASIIGSSWVGQPKISLDEKILCSPDKNDHPQWQPSSYGLPYLRIDRWQDGNFRIEENDGCSSWFGFDSVSYLFQQKGNDVYDYWTGAIVGTISDTKIELYGGGRAHTSILKLVIELQPNGTLNFYSKFKNSGKIGTFEQQGVYQPYKQ